MSLDFNPVTPPFPLAGEVAALTAALIWSVSTSIYRAYGRSVSAAALNFYKCAVAAAFLVVAIIIAGPDITGSLADYLILGASGILGLALGDTALFAALKRLGAQVTSASQCMAPLVSALLAVFILGENLSLAETAGVVTTAVSIALMIHFSRSGGAQLAGMPGRDLAIGIFYAFIAAVCQGVSIVIARAAFQNVHVMHGTLARMLPAIALLGLMVLIREGRGNMLRGITSGRQVAWLVFASFSGTFVGIMLLSFSTKYSKAGIAAALTSTYPVWVIPIALTVLKERVSWKAAACTLFAVGGVVMMMA